MKGDKDLKRIKLSLVCQKKKKNWLHKLFYAILATKRPDNRTENGRILQGIKRKISVSLRMGDERAKE